jgi:hypothetical protein
MSLSRNAAGRSAVGGDVYGCSMGERARRAQGSGEDPTAPRVLTLLRAAVAEVGKAALEPAWMLGDADLGEALSLVGRLRATSERFEVDTVAEAMSRGVPSQEGWGAHDWVSRCESAEAPAPSAGHVAEVCRVATASVRPQVGSAPQAEPGTVATAYAAGTLSLAKADLLVRFSDDMGRVADADQLEADLRVLVSSAEDAPGRPGLTERQLRTAIGYAGALLRPARDLERDEESLRRGRSLTKRRGPAGLAEYILRLDPDGAATVDAAVAALAAPVPGPQGEPDMRSAAHRRADALLTVVGRGVASPEGVTTGERAQVMVTVPLETLRDGVRGGGVTESGEVLSPGALRRLACDAGIVPVVLGSRSEVLDLGRAVRLFTPGQRRLLWRRDGGCSFPGCTVPATWTEAHHVRHWVDGGPTDISNAALLCGRHHTEVHTRALTATIAADGVTWHL